MHLDVRTLVLVAVVVALVPNVIGALIWHTRKTCPGFGRWIFGNLATTLALILFFLRGVAPDWISIVLANVLAAGAAVLFLQGIRQFRGLPLYWWPEYLACALAISAVIYFRYFTNNTNLRILAMGLLLGSCGVEAGFMFLRAAPAGSRISTLLTGTVFTLAGIANLLRGILASTQAPVTDIFFPSLVNAVYFGGTSLCVVSWSFGFILMAGERLAMDSGPTTDAGGSRGFSDEGEAVPEAEVRQQVHRIVKSDVFRRSAAMERFLTLAVERTLEGHPEELKEYALGRDVFNRGENYDPREDSIVRVESQRLRRKLREYYDSHGRGDPVIVEFRAGSYVPAFRYRRSTDCGS